MTPAYNDSPGLVAKPLRLNTRPMGSHFETKGTRGWWAYYCLPRDGKGEPPKFRELERAHGLTNNTLRRFIWDVYPRPGYAVLCKIAAALGTTPEWLESGHGPQPKAEWPVPPRREVDRPKGLQRRTKSGQLKKAAKG